MKRTTTCCLFITFLALMTGTIGQPQDIVNCVSGVVDVMFILDQSGSIHIDDWPKVLNFTSNVVESFNIGSDQIRVGAIKFADDAELLWDMDDYLDKSMLQEEIWNIQHRGGSTNTSGALWMAHYIAFKPARGDRPNVKNAAIVFTDGYSNIDMPRTIPEADMLADLGIEVFVVAVGNDSDLNYDELNAMASDPVDQHLFHVENLDLIQTLVELVSNATCEAIQNPCDPSPCMNGATCHVSGIKYECQCPDGFSGNNCQLEECGPTTADIMFIFDQSGSIYYEDWPVVLNFGYDIIQTLPVTRDTFRVGVIRFSDKAEIYFDLNEFDNRKDLQDAVLDMRQYGGSTNTSGSLWLTHYSAFTTANGDRDNVKNVVILFTDGASNIDESRTNPEAEFLHLLGIEVYVVAVGNDSLNMAELQTIASKPLATHLYNVYNFQDVPQLAAEVSRAACEATSEPCQPNPCVNGGFCLVNGTRFECLCAAGFSGPSCQVGMTCDSSPCENNGTCVSTPNGNYTCTCPVNYSGRNCQIYSPSSPCGQICQDSATNCVYPCSMGGPQAGCAQATGPCAQYPCGTCGQCIANGNSYRCNCFSGFTGPNCKTEINECASSPCANGGNCTDLHNSFQCTCAPGFTGRRCQADINECLSNPCRHGGRCEQGIASYTCFCPAGFTGQRCEENTDECESSPCQNGARCTDQVNGYVCRCLAGYTGINCEVDINDCAFTPCLNGATCVDQVHGFTCVCVSGFEGERCQKNRVNDCAMAPCQNGGTCRDFVGDYRCRCAPGFQGINCEINIDDCATNNCQNGATCVDGIRSFTCVCANGFDGNRCQRNVKDECLSNPCANNGRCVDKVNGYECRCVAGFTGVRCELDIDDCTPQSCQNGGTCIDEVQSFSCSCAPGYSGKRCQQNIKDECISNPCGNNGRCRDEIDSYTCICKKGYEGVNCQINADECSSNPCANGGTCVDGNETFTCICSAGYRGNTCQDDIDECLSNPCQNNGRCANLPGSYQCSCSEGFDGQICEINLDDCDPNPCVNGGTCTDEIKGFTCSCPTGYTGNLCQVIDSCSPNKCMNGGLCQRTDQGFICTCQTGFSGNLCQDSGFCTYTDHRAKNGRGAAAASLDICVSLCRNTVGCIAADYNEDFSICYIHQGAANTGACAQVETLRASSGITHIRFECCENLTSDNCASNPCHGRGKCQGQKSTYRCRCPADYGGINCEVVTATGACSPTSCQNGATCRNTPSGFTCVCPAGFRGLRCQDRDYCSSTPCSNGGTCLNLANGFNCSCSIGWLGARCQDRNECASNPCLNGGRCVDGVNSFSCVCLSGTSGSQCQVSSLCEYANYGIDGGNGEPEFMSKEDCIKLCRNSKSCVAVDYNIYFRQCFLHNDETSSKGDCAKIKKLVSISGIVHIRMKCCDNTPGGACTSRPCQNGGSCTEQGNSGQYSCSCMSDFVGDNCQLAIASEACFAKRCANGGTCVPRGRGSICECPIGFLGESCQDVDPCAIKPCVNGGTCQSETQGFKCLCPNGFTGSLCQDNGLCLYPNFYARNGRGVASTSQENCVEQCRKIQSCVSADYNKDFKQCFLHDGETKTGSCADMLELRENSGIVHIRLQCCVIRLEKTKCTGQTCMNSGQCIEHGNDVKCQCTSGYTGDRCQTFLGGR